MGGRVSTETPGHAPGFPGPRHLDRDHGSRFLWLPARHLSGDTDAAGGSDGLARHRPEASRFARAHGL